MRKSHLIVRAFDGTKREVVGNIELPIQVGPCIFNTEFQVMDINPSYSCLLGRPWIHMAGAVPSSLHQKVKFVVGDKVISVAAEEDMIVATTITAPYIEVNEEAGECSFQSFEIVHVSFVGEKSKAPIPRLSKVTHLGLEQTVGKGAMAGLGLGKGLQGMRQPIMVRLKQDSYGLGYKPNEKEKRRQMEKKKEKRLAEFGDHKIKGEPMTFPPLYETFKSVGFVHPELPMTPPEEAFSTLSINVIGDDEELKDICSMICPCSPGHELSNWTAVDVPAVFKLSE